MPRQRQPRMIAPASRTPIAEDVPLRRQLEDHRAGFMATAEPEVARAMLEADALPGAAGIVTRAVKAGDIATDFHLPDAQENNVSLSRHLRHGPVVISFYRGDWCPYCNLELRCLAARHIEIAALGATLIAISPQKVGATKAKTGHRTSDRSNWPFITLSDHGSKVGKAYGVTFDLPGSLRDIYTRFGHALPAVNGDGDWLLPLPATYVIDRQFRIVLSFVDIDYRHRLAPDDIIAALRGLKIRNRS